MAWQRASGYNKRAGVESQMARCKGALVLNRMLDLGRPNSVRVA